MRCPFCGFQETKVIDSRLVGEGDQVRRRRACLGCEERYTTFETAELSMPRIVKRDDTRESYDEQKLRAGFLKALQKRPVAADQVESAIARLTHRIRASGERELSSFQLGEWVMAELRVLDDVAYVRFASVYRQFQDINAFQEEIEMLKNQPEQHANR